MLCKKHCGSIQKDHLSQNGWGVEGIRKRLPKEEMVETSLKRLVRINQMVKCTKGNCITVKYIHYGVIYLGNISLATVQVFDRGIPTNEREVGRE